MSTLVKSAGRPRDPAIREAILNAAFQFLVERGYDRFALEAVALEAGTVKTNIYRWWSSKAELAVDAFFHKTAEELRLPRTESAREDFRVQILELTKLLGGNRGRALAGMLSGARSNADLAKVIEERWLAPRKKWGFARMTEAAKRGELNQGVEVAAALAALYGPVYTPLLFGQPAPTVEMMEKILSITLAGVFRERTS